MVLLRHNAFRIFPVAMKVFAEGVESFVGDERNENPNDLIPNLSCDIGGSSSQVLGGSRQQQESSWNLGETFHR